MPRRFDGFPDRSLNCDFFLHLLRDHSSRGFKFAVPIIVRVSFFSFLLFLYYISPLLYFAHARVAPRAYVKTTLQRVRQSGRHFPVSENVRGCCLLCSLRFLFARAFPKSRRRLLARANSRNCPRARISPRDESKLLIDTVNAVFVRRREV